MNVALFGIVAAIILYAFYKTIARAKKGSACCSEHETAIKRTGVSDRDKSHYPYEVTADITGMICDNCAARVENALNRIEGIWAVVSVDSKKAKILSKYPIDEYTLKEAVIREGYGISEVQER